MTSVTIASDSTVFGNFTRLVISDLTCGTKLEHSVAAVRFGIDAANGLYFCCIKTRGEVFGLTKVKSNSPKTVMRTTFASKKNYLSGPLLTDS